MPSASGRTPRKNRNIHPKKQEHTPEKTGTYTRKNRNIHPKKQEHTRRILCADCRKELNTWDG